MNVRRHPRIAESAYHDGLELAPQHGEAVRRDRDTVGHVARGAPVELVKFDSRTRGSNDLNGLWNHLLPDPIAGKDCNLLSGSHERELIK
jgi:hypothetical protein